MSLRLPKKLALKTLIPFLRKVFYVFVGSLLIFYAYIGLATVAIYKHSVQNRFTKVAERIFPYPVAMVNGEIIPLSRFRLEVNVRRIFADKHDIKISDKEIEQSVMKQLVNRTLYTQAIGTNSITITDNDVNKRLDTIYSQIGGETNLKKFLNENYGSDMTIPQFKQITKELLAEAAVQYQLLTRVTVRHILFASPASATPDQIEQVRQKALTVRGKLSDLSQFSQFSQQYSEDANSRDKGGALDTTVRGSEQPVLSKDFEDAIFSLPVGQLSQPIRSSLGWHLVVVDKHEGSIDMSLATYTTQLRQKAYYKQWFGQ